LSIVTNLVLSAPASAMNSQSYAEQSLSRTSSSTAAESTFNSNVSVPHQGSIVCASPGIELTPPTNDLLPEIRDKVDPRLLRPANN